MSLICVQCGEIIVLSNHPDHYGNCAACGVQTLTAEQKAQIEQSSREFHAKMTCQYCGKQHDPELTCAGRREKPTQDEPRKWGMRDYGYLPPKENPNKWGGRV